MEKMKKTGTAAPQRRGARAARPRLRAGPRGAAAPGAHGRAAGLCGGAAHLCSLGGAGERRCPKSAWQHALGNLSYIRKLTLRTGGKELT